MFTSKLPNDGLSSTAYINLLLYLKDWQITEREKIKIHYLALEKGNLENIC